MILSQKHEKYNRFSDLNISASFTNQTVSNNASYTYVEAFKSIIEFENLINNSISYQNPLNSKYSVANILDYMIDVIVLGYSRFSHMDDLRNDPVYTKMKSFDLPSEKVCRDLLKGLPVEAKAELRTLNKKLLSLQAKNQEPREVMLDFDDTVCTVFGNQEGSACGYNPRYNGRPSFKEKVGIISQTHELLDVTLEEGTHHSNFNFIEFLETCIHTLPSTWYLKRIRTDRGFFDQKNFEYFENNGYEYVTKAKMQKDVQKIIAYVNEHPEEYPFTKIKKTFSVTEITVPCTTSCLGESKKIYYH